MAKQNQKTLKTKTNRNELKRKKKKLTLSQNLRNQTTIRTN